MPAEALRNLDGVDDTPLTKPQRGRWRLQLYLIAKPVRKFDLSISVFVSSNDKNIDSDQMTYFCPKIVPEGFEPGCRKPLPPNTIVNGVFCCPHCGIVGTEEILGPAIMHLNTTVDKAAKHVYDAWVRCNHDADIYLVRAKRSQLQVRTDLKHMTSSQVELDKSRRNLATERVLYTYDALLKDAQLGTITNRIKAFLGA
jgi:hypothetical protein